jgi:hypothetical protein
MLGHGARRGQSGGRAAPGSRRDVSGSAPGRSPTAAPLHEAVLGASGPPPHTESHASLAAPCGLSLPTIYPSVLLYALKVITSPTSSNMVSSTMKAEALIFVEPR